MTEKKERGLHEFYREDPERADALLFGRKAHPDRRGFLRGPGSRPSASRSGPPYPFTAPSRRA